MKTQKILHWINTFLLVAILVFLIWDNLNETKKEDLNNQILKLTTENQKLISEKQDLQKRLYKSELANQTKDRKIDSLGKALEECKYELNSCREGKDYFFDKYFKTRAELEAKKQELEDLKGEAIELPDSIFLPENDSLTEIEEVSSDTLDSIDVDVSITMKQTSFDKKGNKLNSASSTFYSAPNSILPGKGFEKVDSTGVVSLGNFVTKDNRRVELTYYALVKGETILYQIIETDKETGAKKNLVPVYTEIPSGAGGLLDKRDYIFYEPWTGNYLQEQIDEALKKKAPWQIVKGSIEFAGGIAGYCYFNNNPYVVANIFVDEELAHQQKFYNDFAKGTSLVVAGIGAYKIYRGIKNSGGSVILSPTDITLIFKIDKILNSINNSLVKY